jgi:hypothetical protein
MDSPQPVVAVPSAEFLEADWPRFEGINADAKRYLTMRID